MNNILKSASKIVFILLASTACVGFIIQRLPVDQFMLLASMAFAFYFANKGETNPEVPYAGK